MGRRHIKDPIDWTFCSKCDRPYSFIRCRVTLKNPIRNICLSCGVEEERDGKLKPLPVNLFSTMDPENQDVAPIEETTTPAEAPAEAPEAPAEEPATE